jgi:hypothetical protein
MPCCGPSRAGGLPYMSADAPASISVGLDGATMEYLVIMSTHVPDGTPDQAVADVRSVRQHARVSSPCRRACCGSRPRCRRGCGRTDEVTPLEPDTDTALAVSGAAGSCARPCLQGEGRSRNRPVQAAGHGFGTGRVVGIARGLLPTRGSPAGLCLPLRDGSRREATADTLARSRPPVRGRTR